MMKLQETKRHLDEMLCDGIMSPYAAPVVLVLKKNNPKSRSCVDFRLMLTPTQIYMRYRSHWLNLGHVVSADGEQVDKEKTLAIHQKTSKNSKDCWEWLACIIVSSLTSPGWSSGHQHVKSLLTR